MKFRYIAIISLVLLAITIPYAFRVESLANAWILSLDALFIIILIKLLSKYMNLSSSFIEGNLDTFNYTLLNLLSSTGFLLLLRGLTLLLGFATYTMFFNLPDDSYCGTLEGECLVTERSIRLAEEKRIAMKREDEHNKANEIILAKRKAKHLEIENSMPKGEFTHNGVRFEEITSKYEIKYNDLTVDP